MIVCVSANPAVDRRLRVERLAEGSVNRALSVQPLPGGKAAHVAMAASALGEEVVWVGLLGGATGAAVEQGLARRGIRTVAVRTESETRTNLEIVDEAGVATEVLEPGGAVTDRELAEFLSACDELFAARGNRTQVVLSGSLPPGAPAGLYAELTYLAHRRGCWVLVDGSGEALDAALVAEPDLAKPNRHEAEAVTGVRIADARDAGTAAEALVARGARSAAVSLGVDGLIWRPEAGEELLMARTETVEGRSAVGCGDATAAGFAVARARVLGPGEAIRLAVGCGAANCLASEPGMIDAAEAARLAHLVRCQTLALSG
jgi:1-phosphofructokinase family hexose kinase